MGQTLTVRGRKNGQMDGRRQKHGFQINIAHQYKTFLSLHPTWKISFARFLHLLKTDRNARHLPSSLNFEQLFYFLFSVLFPAEKGETHKQVVWNCEAQFLLPLQNHTRTASILGQFPETADVELSLTPATRPQTEIRLSNAKFTTTLSPSYLRPRT